MKINTLLNEPSLSHRFRATFFIKHMPSPLDFRFQRISGLSRQMSMTTLREGGDNTGSIHLPDQVTHGTLTLERGVIPATPVLAVFNHALSEFANIYMDVVVMLLNDKQQPLCSWTMTNALPMRWQTSNLDASSSVVLVDTLELAYHEMRWLGIRG